MAVQFQGSFTALVTPFQGGKLDEAALRRLIDFQIEGGTDGLVPCGTTGEVPTLSEAERERVVAVTVEQAKGRIPVIAGGPGNDTRRSVEVARRSKELGADAVLAVTPYYNKPTQEGLVRHFAAIAEAGLPIIAYNVPSRTSVDLLPETVGRLAREGIISGLKDATASMIRALELVEATAGKLPLLSGDDFTVAPFIACGGHGVISVSSNAVPKRMKALVGAALAGNVKSAREEQLRLLPFHRALFAETNPIPIKAALAELRICGAELRLPLTPLSEELLPKLRAALSQLS
jgi:4-hydroxy-tetrahydrodipicolinate synthase